jgi:hypothetical protein
VPLGLNDLDARFWDKLFKIAFLKRSLAHRPEANSSPVSTIFSTYHATELSEKCSRDCIIIKKLFSAFAEKKT